MILCFKSSYCSFLLISTSFDLLMWMMDIVTFFEKSTVYILDDLVFSHFILFYFSIDDCLLI